jgi:hypothetical protein
MIKKRNIGILIFLLLIVPGNVFAADYNYGYYGTTTTTASTPLYANSSNGNAAHWVDISVGGSGHGYVVWGGNDGSGHLVEICRNAVPADAVTPCGSGAIAFWFESSGGEIYATIGHTTNQNSLTVYFTNGSSSGGGDGCSSCQMFSCPGWSDYMQGLQDIKNAIPPAPNWQSVANIFRDTIAPQFKADLASVIGTTPDPPAAPAAPNSPGMLDDLDNRGITEPTGNEAPGLGSSTFDANDIKNQAPVIQERQDPTGGFTILDPIAGLPSQDEFKNNKPNEGTANLPGNPKEGDNIAPNPKEGANTAPNPKEGENKTPANPKESENIAPKPKEGSNTAPNPGGSTNPFPIPGGNNGTAPIPGNNGGTAPIPKNDGSTGPLPKENGTAPIPRY